MKPVRSKSSPSNPSRVQAPESIPSTRVESSDFDSIEKSSDSRRRCVLRAAAVSCVFCWFLVDDHENRRGANTSANSFFHICCFDTNTNLRLTEDLVTDNTITSGLLLRFSYPRHCSLHTSINLCRNIGVTQTTRFPPSIRD